ncbi:DUF1456 family protein [Chitinilyticum litopenaei]|uniref:DUF1456 family protein n=1 Tax=Chitinilyticum litopenaei TaxID=1121276 RepID=UPI0004911D45|nr:DUF1456 family protein [Chitinilyticum litopenaei]
MLNNDVLRSIRFMLDLSDARMAELVQSTGHAVSLDDMAAFLKKVDEPGFAECDDLTLAHFLDALIILRRGRDDSRPAPPIELPMHNNLVLKKLRTAFELKDDDICAMLAAAGFSVSKSELSALFRRKDHRHFRPCGDQFLRHFLKGLTQRIRKT